MDKNHPTVYSGPDLKENLTNLVVEQYTEKGQGIPFYLKDIDKDFTPVKRSNLVGILGYTSNYKTGLIRWIARNTVKRILEEKSERKIVVGVTWEQTIEEEGLTDVISMLASGSIKDRNPIVLTMSQILQGKITETHLSLIKEAIEMRSLVPHIYVGHSYYSERRPRMTMQDVYGAFDYIREVMGYTPVMITLDYLQRIERENSDIRVGYMGIVDDCKDLALYSGCPVFLGCQAKRDVKFRKNPIPGVSDGQETSNFEQSADTIISTWLPKNDLRLGTNFVWVKKQGHDDLKVVVDDQMLIVKILKQKIGPAPRSYILRIDYPTGELFETEWSQTPKEELEEAYAEKQRQANTNKK